jgi:hypothetical protein
MRSYEILRRWPGRVASALVVMLAGCAEESGPPRLPVSGKVTLDGKPLPSGTITFLPAGKGAAASVPITDGSFIVGRSEGPGPGTHKVEIVSVQETGKRIKSPDDPIASIEEVRNLIPARYNAGSQLQVEVKSEGENSFQFDLTSREDAPRGRRVAGPGTKSRRSFN